MRSAAFALLAVGLIAPVLCDHHDYKNFHRMFDSEEEDFHNSAEVIRREKVSASRNDGYNVKSACWNKTEGKLYLTKGTDCGEDPKVATGKYANRVNETGWGVLEIQAYAAGVVEGALTRLQIYYHFRNTVEGMCNPTPEKREYCKRLLQSQVLTRNDDYWKMVNLSYTQVTGIFHGYSNNHTLRPVVEFELQPILKVLKKPAELTDDPEPSKCSGFLKVTEGNQDMLFAHVVKLYKFAYDKEKVPGHTYSFSSYAGVIVSSDDYTLLSSGLASIETTIAVFNESLYQEYVKPDQLQCWVRSTISNQMARTGKEWTDIFSRYNSGTYNNQWTVVDYKLFKPGQELPNSDLIWILEQVPGYCESRDVTWFVRKYSYWPSYNIPYQNRVTELAGFDRKAEENNWWRWGYSPRAPFVRLMRYNDYKHDEFSRCQCTPPYSAEAAISTRGDLNPANGTYEISGMGHRNHGSLDYKGTNYEYFQKLRLELIGGPTYGGDSDLPPFDWSKTDIDAPHYGQPTVWKFEPFVTEWETPVEVNLNNQPRSRSNRRQMHSSSTSEEEENRILKKSKETYDF
ncbi:putative phospholipase B-like 2 [Aphelenchoides fujianensis]|nr:putative phospholipase B-like 2 [Aphelenchoides fujianensis]